MVFSINPTAEKTHAQFQANAIAQKGMGAGSAITGNDTAVVPSAAPAATQSAAPTNIAHGQGAMESGACVCAVTCNMEGSYPSEAQGIGAYGGFKGQLPRSMMEAI
jgi:hypothetical protein